MSEKDPRAAAAFYRFLAHMGLGLVTYLPLVFFAVDLIYRRGLSIKDGVCAAFSLPVYILIMSIMGWKFALPGLIIAGAGLSKARYPKLNTATLAIAIIILLWNLLSVAGGT
ncbi:MAG: hypothetical protein PHF11_01000 [Candidatus Omnitrophica bacterium]|nr:hypothetical protein [Candidatus Omnitrophota bacterium]